MTTETIAVADDGSEIGRSAAAFARALLELVGAESVGVSLAEHTELVVAAVAGAPGQAIGERRPATLDPALDRPVRSSTGELVGCVRMVLPADADRPGARRQSELDRYVDQAAAAIGTAVERARLDETIRLARLGRRIVRQLAGITSLAAVDESLSEMLCDAFDAIGLRLRFSDGGLPTHLYSRPGHALAHDPRLDPLAHLAAGRLWPLQQVAIIGVDRHVNATDSPEVQADLVANGLSSEMIVPIGFGEDCLGSLVLLRAAGAPPWSPPECEAALEIGRDLGHVLRRTRFRDRERQLIRELSALNDYRNGLIATVAEQLRGPLDAIREPLAGMIARAGASDEADEAADPSGHDRAAIAAIGQHARRMARVVDDLLLLARLAHPERRGTTDEVDLKAVLRRVAEPMTAAAGHRGLQVETHVPDPPVLMRGSRGELERMLVELLDNAVKYTPRGGRIVVRLSHFDAENVLLTVADTGIGIPLAEQGHVFDDFFRGSPPEVAATPGSGLGLAIVERVVRRHGGHARLSSEPGRGTTFSVGLPLSGESHPTRPPAANGSGDGTQGR